MTPNPAKRIRMVVLLVLGMLLAWPLCLSAKSSNPFSADSTASDDQKWVGNHDIWVNVLRIVEKKTNVIYEALEDYKELPDSQVDSILQVWFARKDIATRPDTPHQNEWRIEMERRLEFCYEKFSNSEWEISPEDLRLRTVILNGIPSEFEEDDSVAESYMYMIFRNGVKVKFFSDASGGTPWRLRAHPDDVPLNGSDRMARANKKLQQHKRHITTTEEFVQLMPPFKELITPVLDLVSIPDDGDNYSILISSAVLAKQIAPDSSGHARLWKRTAIYSVGAAPALVVLDSADMRFQRAGVDDRALYPMYESYSLPAGMYTVALTIYDTGGDLGIQPLDFSLPSNLATKGLSDVLLTTETPQQQFTNPVNRFVRNGLVMKGNAYPVYYEADDLYFYAEANLETANFKKDAQGDYAFRVYCNILNPKSNPKSDIVSSDSLLISRDSTLSREAEELIRRRSEKMRGNEFLIYSSNESSFGARQVISGKAEIPKMKHGKYFLVMRVDDALSPASLIAAKTIYLK